MRRVLFVVTSLRTRPEVPNRRQMSDDDEGMDVGPAGGRQKAISSKQRQAERDDKPQAHRMRQVLVDYANALTILDWQAETKAKRTQYTDEDDPERSDEAIARHQAERAAGKAEADAELEAAFAEYERSYPTQEPLEEEESGAGVSSQPMIEVAAP